MSDPVLLKWRLVLGAPAHTGLGSPGLDAETQAQDAALEWLYGRGGDLAGGGDAESRDILATRGAGLEGSVLSVPDWINEVHRLFPKDTIERLERDAVERYQINEVVTNPEVLKRVTPSPSLLEAVLRVKHLMNPEVLTLARDLIQRVVRELMNALATEVRASRGAMRSRRFSTTRGSARDFDPHVTIRRNLRHWSVPEGRLYIQRPYFTPRLQRDAVGWQLILLVDQSASMVRSVIHSAVTAACFCGLPSIKTHLCAFDTEVVDFTDRITDPVEVLMKVQLGGGTDIARAVDYAAGLVVNPRRTIVVLISDFFEGGDARALVQRVKGLCSQGSHVLGVAALDAEAVPEYDHDMARRLVDAGAHVAALTPSQLAAWVLDKVRG
jgi:Mg-chelatase subunit ChlD